MSERFDDFGRGIVSLSSFAYFALVAAVGLYLCMVLIGRRHWSGGKEGNFMFAQYLTRIVCLAIVAVAGSFFFRNHDLRYDLTDGKISSISAVTRKIIRDMKPDRTIFVNAFISSEIPEIYAKTRYELIHMLKEFESAANGSNRPMVVRIQDGIDVFSDEAKQAEKGFGIAPQTVRVRERGQIKDQQVILGAAFTSGLQKVVVPFFSTGVPVEYELVRSLKTVAQSAKKKLGVLKTDAQLTGGFSMTTFSQTPRQPIITELEKQYEIVDVNPASPISPEMMDVLLAVQPSSLGPAEMNNFIDAVKAGIPTAVFEDPRPDMYQDVPGTGEPKRQGGAMGMFGGGGQQPKGDIRPLWKLLGLKIPGGPSMTGGINPDLVWQQYNPYPILASINDITDEWVFVREGLPGVERTFNDQSEITED
jgi:ABC-2 type transport system permease protein